MTTSRPAPPTAVDAPRTLLALHRLILRLVVSPGRLLVVGALVAMMLLVGFAVGRSSDTSASNAAELVQNLGLAVVVPVVSLVFATAALGDMRDDRTLVYLWLRPLPRWIVPLAAITATSSVVVPVGAVSLGAGAALAASDGGVVAGAVVAGALGALAYTALFVALSLVLKRVLMWGLAYILIWEGFVAGGAAGAARLAIRSYTSSIVADLGDVSVRLGTHSGVLAACVLVAVAGVSLAVAVGTYARLDVD